MDLLRLGMNIKRRLKHRRKPTAADIKIDNKALYEEYDKQTIREIKAIIRSETKVFLRKVSDLLDTYYPSSSKTEYTKELIGIILELNEEE